MIQIDSNTLTDEELSQVMHELGAEVPGEAKPAEEPAVDGKDKNKSEPAEKLGEHAEAAAGEAPAGTEPTDKNKQEGAPEGETEEEKAKREKTSKGGWQRKIDTLTARVDTLKDELDEERGDKTRLKAKLDQAEAELEQLKAGGGQPSEEPASNKGPAKPKRPKMPQLSDFDFDADKFAEAQRKYAADVDKYDEDMDLYFRAVADQTANEKLEAARKADAAAVEEAKSIEIENAFVDRKEEGKKHIPDFQEMLDRLPRSEVTYLDKNVIPGTEQRDKDNKLIPGTGITVAGAYIKYESDAPADLIYYFAKDHLENDGAEGERLVNLSPAKQVIELKKIEEKLIAARTAPVVPAKDEKKPAAAAAPPANPKPQRKTPDEPLDPVGGRGGSPSAGADLQKQLEAAAEAGNNREYSRIRALMQQEAAKARRAG